MNVLQLVVLWVVVDLGASAAHLLWQTGDARSKDDRDTGVR